MTVAATFRPSLLRVPSTTMTDRPMEIKDAVQSELDLA